MTAATTFRPSSHLLIIRLIASISILLLAFLGVAPPGWTCLLKDFDVNDCSVPNTDHIEDVH
jgi:hypothetical protein